MGKNESALSTIGYIILGIVIAYTVNLALSAALNTSMPVVAVESNSMVPTFYRGDILILNGVNASSLKVGDIIVYSPDGQVVPIVHMIIAINPDGSFQTKGDANAGQLAFEKHVTVSEIHGVMIGIIPYAGWIKIAVTDYIIPNMLWIAVAAVLALAAVYGGKHLNRSGKI
jgi:signal peptidase